MISFLKNISRKNNVLQKKMLDENRLQEGNNNGK
jgi:hypothetical protein